MKTPSKYSLRKPLLVGLSLGITGVFYFYLNHQEVQTGQMLEECDQKAQECKLEQNEAHAALDPKKISSEQSLFPKTEQRGVQPSSENQSKKHVKNQSQNSRKKAKGYNFRLIDTTGDGKPDSVDVDLDGEADYILGDLDGDGIPDFADLDGDTVSDVVFYDDNRDGLIDTFDTDMNQRPNGIFVDLDGDKFAEAAVVQDKTEICYVQNSGLRQARDMKVRTASLSDYLARGAKIGNCSQSLAQKEVH